MTDPSADRLAPGAVLGERYRLDAIVGVGGMAVVWRAEDIALGRTVAVKVMSNVVAVDPRSLSRFEREARIAAQISHPNLIQVFDFSATSPQPYLVMEFVDGGTLDTRLERGALSGEAARRLAADLLHALEAVHGRGVLHRDVKPANVLFAGDGRAQLTDFGIARQPESTHLTQTGHVIGTLRYLAPEVIDGGGADARSDLYSLGVLLDVATTSDRDATLTALIGSLRAVSPESRPRDAAAALGLLTARPRAVAAKAPPAPTAVQPRPATPRASGVPADATRATQILRPPANRLRWAAAAVGVAAVVIAALVILTSGGGSRVPAATGSGTRTAGQRPLGLQQRLSSLEDQVRALPTR